MPTTLSRRSDRAVLTSPAAATALGWDLAAALTPPIVAGRKHLGDLIAHTAQGRPQILRRHATPVAVLLPAAADGTPLATAFTTGTTPTPAAPAAPAAPDLPAAPASPAAPAPPHASARPVDETGTTRPPLRPPPPPHRVPCPARPCPPECPYPGRTPRPKP